MILTGSGSDPPEENWSRQRFGSELNNRILDSDADRVDNHIKPKDMHFLCLTPALVKLMSNNNAVIFKMSKEYNISFIIFNSYNLLIKW